jgi:putative membrane protein (TIGR04086 family)
MSNLSKQLIISVLAGLISTFIVCIFLSVVIANLWLSTQSIEWLTCIAMALGGLVGGFVAGKLSKQKGMLIGMLVGVIMMCVYFTLGLFFDKVSFGLIDISQLVVKFLQLILAGAIGGITGININKT